VTPRSPYNFRISLNDPYIIVIMVIVAYDYDICFNPWELVANLIIKGIGQQRYPF
jgi:hypothetical protein